ncbi:hypothetical protein [Zoogloea sp.]|uniref:hypothetical protein n=1 Tax=Zoogloea sp. TaxID=49181 RepID=UPI0014159829|nr:MAG: hypothetical protein F9K15_23100 [Zoogloea sp.]
MSQNVVSLSLSTEQIDQVHSALAVLEKNLSGLVSLSADQRRELNKMGPKSEMFARKAYDVVAQSPDIMPGSFELDEFAADIAALDQLRPIITRLVALAQRGEDTEMALGSDIYSAALEGYRFAKLAGKGTALDELRNQAAVRFAGQGRRRAAAAGEST